MTSIAESTERRATSMKQAMESAQTQVHPAHRTPRCQLYPISAIGPSHYDPQVCHIPRFVLVPPVGRVTGTGRVRRRRSYSGRWRG